MKIRIYDNKGKTWDRYTVMIPEGFGYHVYGMSENPTSPNGFNQYCLTTYGIVDSIRVTESENIGDPVKLSILPQEVQMAIKERQ